MDDTSKAQRRPALALAALLLAVTAVHLFVFWNEPQPKLWGDEPMYQTLAEIYARTGETSLLPGFLPFEHQPQLHTRLYAWFGGDVYRTASILNILLLPFVLAATFAQALLLGMTWRWSLGATALLGFFPWFGFHVHSLWPEVLHALFFGLALLLVLAYLRRERLWLLALAGVATAFALLTKGVLNPFVPVIAIFLGATTFRARRADEAGRRWLRTLAAPGTYLLTALVVLTPQLVRNERAGHGPSLAANRWWNLEIGLRADPPATTVGAINQTYLEAAQDPVERERLSKERTLAHLRETGVLSLAANQLAKMVKLVHARRPAFEMSLERIDRWGPEPPWWLAALRVPARLYWYALLALAAAGAAVCDRRDPAWLFLLVLTACYGVALFAVPLKIRFVLPIVPVLVLFAGRALATLRTRLSSSA